MKHSDFDLAQMQSLSLNAKIRMSKQRIRIWYEHWNGEVYASVSGIDSAVMKHLIDSMYDDVPALYVNTGLEYIEVQRFWREVKNGKYECFNNDVEIVRPEMRFDEVIKKYGYPLFSKETAKNIEYGRKALARGDKEKFERYVNGRRVNKETGEVYKYGGLSKLALKVFYSNIPVSNKCCKVMKKKPAALYEKLTVRKAFIGTQAQESKERALWWKRNGCNAFNKKRPTSQPLSFWTKQDILEYARLYNVPYPEVYGDIIETSKVIERIDGEHKVLKTTGCDRTGCMFCLFGAHCKDDERFLRMKETHPRQYDYCINGGHYNEETGYLEPDKNGLGIGKVLDSIGASDKY